jgi:hypothetical protein
MGGGSGGMGGGMMGGWAVAWGAWPWHDGWRYGRRYDGRYGRRYERRYERGGSNSIGNWRSMYRAYMLIYTIQQTVEPETWYEEGGEGRIDQFSESKLVIFQTPEVHAQIRELLDLLREGLGQQIAIEARFLLVDENFLEDIGLDVDISTMDIGGKFGNIAVEQNSSNQTKASPSNNISSSLARGMLLSIPA